jgi:hypothetical protein
MGKTRIVKAFSEAWNAERGGSVAADNMAPHAMRPENDDYNPLNNHNSSILAPFRGFLGGGSAKIR